MERKEGKKEKREGVRGRNGGRDGGKEGERKKRRKKGTNGRREEGRKPSSLVIILDTYHWQMYGVVPLFFFSPSTFFLS